jgi:hypothetical protein
MITRDPMRAFNEMIGHIRLISELYQESKALFEEILQQVARDVAGRIERERAAMWTAVLRSRGPQQAASAALDGKGGRNCGGTGRADRREAGRAAAPACAAPDLGREDQPA